MIGKVLIYWKTFYIRNRNNIVYLKTDLNFQQQYSENLNLSLYYHTNVLLGP